MHPTNQPFGVGSVYVSGNDEPFLLSEFLVSGKPPVKGVGPKLEVRIRGYYAPPYRSGTVGWFMITNKISDADAQDYFREHGFELLTWGHVREILEDKLSSSRILETGLQLATYVDSGFQDTPLVLRAQVNWEEGHNIGQKPEDPSWMWSENTVFGALFPKK